MRNIDVLNNNLKKFTLPDHRKEISESLSNLEWLKKNLTKKNLVDDETMRLLKMSPLELRLEYAKL